MISLSFPLSSCSSWAARTCYSVLYSGNPLREDAQSPYGVMKLRISCQRPTYLLLPISTSIVLAPLVLGVHLPPPQWIKRRAEILPSSVLGEIKLGTASAVKERRQQDGRSYLSRFWLADMLTVLFRLLDIQTSRVPPPLRSSSHECSLATSREPSPEPRFTSSNTAI